MHQTRPYLIIVRGSATIYQRLTGASAPLCTLMVPFDSFARVTGRRTANFEGKPANWRRISSAHTRGTRDSSRAGPPKTSRRHTSRTTSDVQRRRWIYLPHRSRCPNDIFTNGNWTGRRRGNAGLQCVKTARARRKTLVRRANKKGENSLPCGELFFAAAASSRLYITTLRL